MDPKRYQENIKRLIFGYDISEVDQNILKNASCFFVYANQVANHLSVTNIINFLKKNFTSIPVVVLENSQAVTAYSLSKIKNEFFDIGCDYIIIGDLEKSALKLYNNLNETNSIKNIGGVISKEFINDKIDFVEDLDVLDFPSWEDFPLKNYWELGYSHGPLSNKKYLPMLTSRGCPYQCNF